MKTLDLKVIFFGTPDFVVPVLKKVQENFDLVGVVTAPTLTSPVKLASQGESLEPQTIFTPEKLDQDLAQKLADLQPDLFVIAAYGKIIPQFILDIPKFGGLNIHPSLLPKYRGPSPIQTAILNGDKISGVTIIKIDEQMDHGPIIYTKEISLSDQDTCETLSKKLFEVGAQMLVKMIPDFVSGKIKPVVQDDKKAIYCPMIKKEDGYFDLSNPPSQEKLDRMIRAYFPWPGVWTKWEGKIVKFLPGKVIQMEGKKPVKFEDFLRGYPNFPLKEL